MVSGTRYVPRAKNKMDDNNLKKKISKRTEVGNYNSDISSLRRLGRETSLSRHSTPNPPSTTKSKQHLENEKRKKETKEKNVIQLLMESDKAEIRLEFNRKREKMTAHTYKAQFKAQRMRTVVSDTDEVIEGPNKLAMDKIVDGPPDSADSENSTSLPRSRDGTVHSETGEKCRDPKDINGVMVGSERLSVAVMDNVVNQPSDGDCLKESCASLSVKKLHTNSSPVKNLNSLEKEASTCSAGLQDGVVSESGEKFMHPEGTEATLFPESVNDSLPAICNVCSKRKRVSSGSTENNLCSCGGAVNKDLCRLSTCKKRVQYSNESPSEPNTDNSDVGKKRRKVVNENVDTESVQVELNGHQVTQVADRERGPSIIATCNQSQSLQKNGVTATSNLNSKQTSSGEISLSDEKKSLYSSLLEELMKLCNILKLSEDVTHMGRRFLEYVIKNHHVSSDSPAIVQAFQISLCWVATSISKQTVDKKDSLILAKQHLNYQCTEVNVQSVYSKMRALKRMYLSEQDLEREPFNECSAKPVDVKKEIGVKSPNEEHGRSEINIKISEIEKKCRKRQKKLQRKQQEKIQEFHKIWNQKRTQLEDDHGLETAFIRSLHRERSVRTEKLKCLNETFAQKIEDHNLLKGAELKNLEAEQLAAMNEEKQKAERWLTAAKACYSEPIAVNSPPLLESRSTYNAGLSQLAIRTVDATGVVTESTQQLADQNPGDSESTRHSVGQNPSESESTRHLEDQNPSESGPAQHIENQNPSESESTQHLEVQNPGESVCAHGNASAIATISISASAKAVHCDISADTRNLVDNDSRTEVVVKDIAISSMEVVEQPNQSKHLCDNRELVCSELASRDQSINLTTESPVEVPETAPNENVSQDKVHSSSAELVNQNELVVQNQHDSQVEAPELEPVDTVTAVQSNGELEEGEIQEEEEPTMENQGTINSESVAIVDHLEEEPTVENQRTVYSETVANVEPVLITEQPGGNVPFLENQVETSQPVNDSLADGQSNVEPQDLVTPALEIESTSEVANSDLVDNVDPTQPIMEQPQADSPSVENQNISLSELPISSQTADMTEIEVLTHEPASQIEPVQPNRNTSLIEVPFSSQIADVSETEALSHEPVSQSVGNLETRSVSDEHIVELGTSSESNEPICESVIGEAELSIGAAVQNGISASYLYGSGYLVPSLNRLSFDPIASELEKTSKEKEEFEKSHANMTAQLKSNCKKEIEEMTYQIKQKYGMKLQVAETEFRHRKNEFKKFLKKLQMNMKLAEASRAKLAHLRPIGHPVNQQGTSQSVYMQQMHHLSVHPSPRVISTTSNFQPSPGHSNASFVGPHIMPHQPLARPTRYSPITGHSVTGPPVHSVQHMQALFSIPPRPLPVIRSITPTHNPRVSGELRTPAPHLQSFRPSVGPTVPLTASPFITQYRPMFQNGPGPQGGLLAQPGPHPSTMTSLWEMDPWSCVRTNSSSIFSEIRPNYTSLGQSQLGVQGNNVQGNRSSSVVANDVVCLSDDD